MPCVHLKRLYQLCVDEKLKLSGSDLIHIICEQCGKQEVCPSAIAEPYDEEIPEEKAASANNDKKSGS